MIQMTLDQVRELVETILRRHGFSEPHVLAVAGTILAGERDGCTSHGVYRLPGCVATLKAGKVSPTAEPEVFDCAPSVVRVDAHGAFAQCAYLAGLPLLVEKARRTGIAILAINRCVHFSALWPEVEPLTEQGLVALAFTPSHAWVAPAGGIRPLFGTNPIAFGWPRPDKPPFLFDFATSAAARGEIDLHRRAGKPIPLGWGIDQDGQPTTDPLTALNGAMLTFGGHKGSALAAMVELIAGPMIGDLTSAESLAFDEGTRSSPYGGELIIAIDPRRILGAEADQHLQRAEAVFEGMLGQGARLPSQRRYEARARSAVEGVRIPEAMYAEIQALLA
ncbi:Ldh family oxidoreductase [Metapseudomonas boanensis]|uniref:Ldh family oxidoreductase n=1 Tax=Metapseudomonas boanensis TaxID=2822138 RepID=A0ABS5XK26_9GAMM|nr:Ldh family oxidoreductase [Pseudomonas boanensis]MBT8768031.1 Ldh family oxidoreductase [Pseudomonas boanensis]